MELHHQWGNWIQSDFKDIRLSHVCLVCHASLHPERLARLGIRRRLIDPDGQLYAGGDIL